MEPNYNLINYLINSNCIKNYCSYNFAERNNFKINLTDFICYTLGNSNNRKYVNCFKFLGESCNYKLKNYYIRWWNSGCFEDIDQNVIFDYVDFWVHSGMTLRKNFFNYEDRMSLFRTTFIYDELTQTFFRLSQLSSFIVIPEMIIFKNIIFSSPEKYYYIEKIKKNKKEIKKSNKNKQLEEIQKKLNKIIVNKNYKYLIKKYNNKLFEELENFINLQNGDTTTIKCR